MSRLVVAVRAGIAIGALLAIRSAVEDLAAWELQHALGEMFTPYPVAKPDDEESLPFGPNVRILGESEHDWLTVLDFVNEAPACYRTSREMEDPSAMRNIWAAHSAARRDLARRLKIEVPE